MAKSKMYEIDGEKLRQEFAVRKLSLSEVSENCGFEKSYFSKVVNSNKLIKPAMNLLAIKYNIPFEAYKPDVVEEKQEIQSIDVDLTLTDEMSDKLYQIIYTAVYQAVKKAWSE